MVNQLSFFFFDKNTFGLIPFSFVQYLSPVPLILLAFLMSLSSFDLHFLCSAVLLETTQDFLSISQLKSDLYQTVLAKVFILSVYYLKVVSCI